MPIIEATEHVYFLLSYLSVFPHTRAWKQQERNKTKTDEDGKNTSVSMERSKAGTIKRCPDGLSHPNKNIIINIIWSYFIIIYHDFLPTPRRGSHVKSDKTHTQSSRYTP